MKRPGALLMVLACTLCACTGIGQKQRNWPGSYEGLFQTLPPGYEVTALLKVLPEDVQYLLALSTRPGTGQLRALSVHGIPAFSAQNTAGGIRINEKVELSTSLTATDILSYLLLAWGDETTLRSDVLKPGYSLLANTQRRGYKNSRNGETPIRIDYVGRGPWYETITLNDQEAELNIVITTLEILRVHPQ